MSPKNNNLGGKIAAAFATGNIALANDQSLLYPAYTGDVSVPHNTILAVNDANFDAQYLSEPLNDYIVGAPEDDGIQAVLDILFPAIPVGRSFTYRSHDTREQFQADDTDDADIREINGDFKSIRRTGTQQEGRTDNKGLIMILDQDQGGDDIAVQQRAVVNLRSRLYRTELKRGLTVLDTIDSNTNVNWGPGNADRDPDMDLLEAVDAGGDARGVDSNIVVIGGGARIKRKRALRSKNNPDMVGARLTDAELAEDLGVDQVVTLKNRFQSGANTRTKVLGDRVFAYYTRKGGMQDDPSNVKRFVTPTASGLMRVYIMQKLKKTLVCVEHYSRILGASNLGVESRTVTFTA